MAEEKTHYPVEPIQRLQFLMKSGNSFTIDGVEDWGMRHEGNRIVSLRLKQSLAAEYARVIVESIDLTQIEAIVVLPKEAFHG